MIHIVICDDNSLHLSAIARLITQRADQAGAEVSVLPFSSPASLEMAMESREVQAEIAVLDIDMEGMDGIALAKRINVLAPRCQILFLTAYVMYAMDVYETNHAYFILKEKQEERLWPAIEKAWLRYRQACRETIAVRCGRNTVVLQLDEIRYLERQMRKTYLQTGHATVYTHEALDGLERRLPSRFVRCHVSFIVNLDAVRELGNAAFILKNGKLLPISRSFKKRTEERFWAYVQAPVREE